MAGVSLAGRPVANATIYVLGEEMGLQPVGVPGEAHLGGAGVADGYLNRADLTAERFVANPFGTAGSRLYKSGDRVRWCPGGAIEFLGRTDFQVKIRGYRVEPGEIEEVLLTHPNVTHAVVTARVDPVGRNRPGCLCGRPWRTACFSTSDLRAHMKRSLPHYMVPSRMRATRCATAQPERQDRSQQSPRSRRVGVRGAPFEPPCTTDEAAIAILWADVLGLRRVGRHDNFFDLGGNSLKAVRMLHPIPPATQRQCDVGDAATASHSSATRRNSGTASCNQSH